MSAGGTRWPGRFVALGLFDPLGGIGMLGSEEAEHEDADGRRQVAVGPFPIHLAHQVRQLRVLRVADVAQTFPELVLQRDARLVAVENDRTLYDRGFHVVLLAPAPMSKNAECTDATPYLSSMK